MVHYTGTPDVVELWGEKLFGTDGPTKGATDSDRARPGDASSARSKRPP